MDFICRRPHFEINAKLRFPPSISLEKAMQKMVDDWDEILKVLSLVTISFSLGILPRESYAENGR